MFAVGPESAGAHPGPVCYRKGGSLTVTDANLVLGRLLPEFFPCIFGPTEDQPLDKEGSVAAFKKLAEEVSGYIYEGSCLLVKTSMCSRCDFSCSDFSFCSSVSLIYEKAKLKVAADSLSTLSKILTIIHYILRGFSIFNFEYGVQKFGGYFFRMKNYTIL